MATNLAHYYRVIEEAISKIGLDPAEFRTKTTGRWVLKKGSVEVVIDAFSDEKQEQSFFQVLSPIMELPITNTRQFFQDLLTMNHGMIGTSFSLYKEVVWLKSARIIDGMDNVEALTIISTVGTIADNYDDVLKEKYGRSRPVGFQIPQRTVIKETKGEE
ncbi:MAG: YbjN domain-containing protein [Chitinophagales bacterium]